MSIKDINNINGWYVLTELANDILVQVSIMYRKLAFTEKKKEMPNLVLIDDYIEKSDKSYELANTPEIFQSKDKMREIINEYSKILDSLINE
ncbi:hypothetical protein [Chryseobacterium oncorhynchi]|uniref:Uncharacterized protein n=1 Tax=Chryseobacterium oncorhynchi TaxID=741074 RepID=A0A316WN56_9FLAO|nr:hypothetical protein [Chryseobacterium oncorhynchi]PWN59960.1 hypothetical protein C1638_020550 [Chryseobacterium oncorhynchi]